MRLPDGAGGFLEHRPTRTRPWVRPDQPPASRIAYAAAHVVADPLGDNVPGAPARLDWDATLAFRRHLWSYGLGVAEAMDTAQRGMGLDWPAAAELIRRSAAEAKAVGGRIAAGAGTDHRPDIASVAEVTAAYLEQLEVVEQTGAKVIVMASRQLAALARGADDYHTVYGKVFEQVSAPVIVHWLGPMFDPALAGYWGSRDLAETTESFVSVIRAHQSKVDGVKVSLLDAEHEIRLRAELPADIRVYTGDDFNYPELIRGDQNGHSDALLGVFAAIAPAASAALQALDAGDTTEYERILTPTVPLARQLFAAPTYYYKAGIAFLAWLSGHQPGFNMVGGLQNGRSAVHLATVYRLADELGLFPDPELAAARMEQFLNVAGLR